MVLSAAEVGVFLCALTGRVMGISGNNTVGSVQTRSESKQRGGQADGGNISHHTGNGPAAAGRGSLSDTPTRVGETSCDNSANMLH